MDVVMAQERITILRVHKRTRNRLRRLALAKRESYDEIINRLIGSEPDTEDEADLEKRRQKLIKMGVSKDLASLVGILPKTDTKEERRMIREAVKDWESRRRG